MHARTHTHTHTHTHARARRFDPPQEGAGQPTLTRQQVLSACDASLRRLQTTYIDLYQIHCERRRAGARARGTLHTVDSAWLAAVPRCVAGA
jgi:aryl-alcohol dehydrogenase-like predicted oxidoreductase